MRVVAILAATALLAACGGGGAASQADRAVAACDAYAKSQLNDKTYQLDKGVLGASMKGQPDGSMLLTGPIVIDPGTATESKQKLECAVRFTNGKDVPDVLRMQFIW